MKCLKLAITATAIATIAGCASPMPDTHYMQFSNLTASLVSCHGSGRISSELYSKAIAAMAYTLNTWDFDKDRFEQSVNYKLTNNYFSDYQCNTAKKNSKLMMANVQRRKSSQAAAQQGLIQLSSSLNSLGQAFNQAAQSYQNAAQQQAIQNSIMEQQWAEKEREKETFYEYTPNPLNTLPAQTYERSTKSASGRVTCIYSLGATLVLPYGKTICPMKYN